MKKSILILSAAAFLLLNGCGSSLKGVMIYETDPTLKTIKEVRSLPTQNAVGFAWKKIEDRTMSFSGIYS